MAYVCALFDVCLEVLHVLQCLCGERLSEDEANELHEQSGEAKFTFADPLSSCTGHGGEAIANTVEDTLCFVGAIVLVGQPAIRDRLDHFDASFPHLEDQSRACPDLIGLTADQFLALQPALPAGAGLSIFKQLQDDADWPINDDFDGVFHG